MRLRRWPEGPLYRASRRVPPKRDPLYPGPEPTKASCTKSRQLQAGNWQLATALSHLAFCSLGGRLGLLALEFLTADVDLDLLRFRLGSFGQANLQHAIFVVGLHVLGTDG